MLEALVLFILFVFFLAGSKKLGELLSGGLYDKKIPSFLLIFWGVLPLLLLQVILSALFWGQEIASLFYLKTAIFCAYFGLGSYSLFLERKQLLLSFKKNLSLYLVLFLGLGLVFLPALFMRGAFEPSWDSDFIIFWFQRYKSIVHYGSLVESLAPQNASYVSIVYLLLGYSVAWPLEAEPLSQFLRFQLLFLLFVFCFDLINLAKGRFKFFMLLPLLSGYPLKWINGYQDTWVASFFVFTVLGLWRKEKALFWAALVCLFLAKDEGMLWALSIFLFAFIFSRELLKIKNYTIPVLSLCGWGVWKAFSLFKHLNGTKISFEVSLGELLSRAGIFLELFGKGIGRAYQSWILEGFLCFGLVVWNWKTLKSMDRKIVLFLLLCFFLPFLGVLFTPHSNFKWHLEATIARIGTAALMAFIVMAFELLGQGISSSESQRKG